MGGGPLSLGGRSTPLWDVSSRRRPLALPVAAPVVCGCAFSIARTAGRERLWRLIHCGGEVVVGWVGGGARGSPHAEASEDPPGSSRPLGGGAAASRWP